MSTTLLYCECSLKHLSTTELCWITCYIMIMSFLAPPIRIHVILFVAADSTYLVDVGLDSVQLAMGCVGP